MSLTRSPDIFSGFVDHADAQRARFPHADGLWPPPRRHRSTVLRTVCTSGVRRGRRFVGPSPALRVSLLAFAVLCSVGAADLACAAIDAWSTHGPDGGSISALAIDPATPSTLYAGTVGGGVFKSADGGATWRPRNTGLTNLSIGALAIDPAIPSTLHAATFAGAPEDFLSRPGQKLLTFRTPGDGVERPSAWIPVEEIQLAVLHVVEDQFGGQRGALPKAVAELFGFDRTPSGLAELVAMAVDMLVDEKRLQASGPNVYLL